MRKHQLWNKTKKMCEKGAAVLVAITVLTTSFYMGGSNTKAPSNIIVHASESSAKQAMEAAKKEWESAENAVVTAQSKVDAAIKAAKDAKSLKSQGSYGYFKKNGYEDAVAVLESKEEWVTKYTTIGDAKDATGYDNFRDSIAFLEETNEYRLKEGVDPTSKKSLGELQVSMQLMAISEVQSNWSAANMKHSQKYSVSENLAWGYDDPFMGWFDKEKAIWLAALQNSSQYPNLSSFTSAYDISIAYPAFYQSVGHYLNICNASSKYMGFSMNLYGNYGITHGQVFKGSGVRDTMTVAEFKQSVENYCADIDAKIKAESSANADLEAAKNLASQKKTAYNNSLTAYNAELSKSGSAIVTENSAISNKSTIKTVIVADTVKTLKNNRFVGCKKLKTITLGKNVKTIQKKAFAGCKSVKTIVIKTKKLTNKSVAKKSFGVFSKKTVAKVPKSKYKFYKKLLKKKGFKGKVKKI